MMDRYVFPTLLACGLPIILYIGYKYFMDQQRFEKKRLRNQPLNNVQKPGHFQHVQEPHAHRKISPKTMNQIQGVEHCFFTGIYKKCSLNESDYQSVRQSAMQLYGSISEDAGNLEQLLICLRNNRILRATNYQEVVSKLFEKAGIKLSPESRRHLRLLEETVNDLKAQDLLEQDDDAVYDAVLLYAENDDSLAKDFHKHLESQVLLPDLKIGLQDDFGQNEGILRGWEHIFEKAIYIFVLVSHNFIACDTKRFTGEATLLESLKNQKAKWRVVPVWMESSVLEHGQCPFELSAIQGIKYYCYMDDENDTRCFRSIERLITNGRKQHKKDYCANDLTD